MKDTPFGPSFLSFYNEKFETEKGLKSNVSVSKIVDKYNRNLRCFKISGKRIQLTKEDMALTSGLPIEGADFIMNKTYTLKDKGVNKHYFKNYMRTTTLIVVQ